MVITNYNIQKPEPFSIKKNVESFQTSTSSGSSGIPTTTLGSAGISGSISVPSATSPPPLPTSPPTSSGITSELKLDLNYDLLNHDLEKKLKKVVIDLLSKKNFIVDKNQISFKNGSIIVVISNIKTPADKAAIDNLNNDVTFKKLLENEYNLKRCPCDPNDSKCKCNKKMDWWILPLILFILFLIGLFVFVGIAVDYRK